MEIKIKRVVRGDGRVSLMDSGGNWYSTFVTASLWDTRPEEREILNTVQEGEIVEIGTSSYTSKKTGKTGLNITSIVRIQYQTPGTDGPPPPEEADTKETIIMRECALRGACEAAAGQSTARIGEIAVAGLQFLKTGEWPKGKEEDEPPF